MANANKLSLDLTPNMLIAHCVKLSTKQSS